MILEFKALVFDGDERLNKSLLNSQNKFNNKYKVKEEGFIHVKS